MKNEQGSVTIMMCILFLVFIMLAGVLIDSARFIIAEVQIKRAARTAANSILSEYDIELKEQYGLFAFDASDTTKISKKAVNYMERSLNPTKNMRKGSLFTWLANGESADFFTYFSEKSQGYVTPEDNFISDKSSLMPVSWNLWQYHLPETVYKDNLGTSLANKDVFEHQILEYMKYRAPVQAVEGFLNKLGLVFRAKESTELTKERNQVEKKMEELGSLVGEIIKLMDGWYFDKDNKFQCLEEKTFFLKKLKNSHYYWTNERLEPAQLNRIFKLLETNTTETLKSSPEVLKNYYNTCFRWFIFDLYSQYFLEEIDRYLSSLKEMAYYSIEKDIDRLESDIRDIEKRISNKNERISELQEQINQLVDDPEQKQEINQKIEDIGDAIKEEKEKISDYEKDISKYNTEKRDVERCTADEFAKNYMNYVKSSNNSDPNISTTDINRFRDCADLYNQYIDDIDEAKKHADKYKSIYEMNVEKVNRNILKYKDTCTYLLGKFEEFEESTKAAKKMLEDFDNEADVKKDSLLPGVYEDAKSFVSQTKGILDVGADPIIDHANNNIDIDNDPDGAIEIIRKNIEILDECLRVLEEEQHNIKTGSNLVDEAQNINIVGEYTQVKSKHPNSKELELSDFSDYSSLLDTKEGAEGLVHLCNSNISDMKRVSDLIYGYRTDVKLNNEYKGFEIKTIKESGVMDEVEDGESLNETLKETVKNQKDNMLKDSENSSSNKMLTEQVVKTLPSSHSGDFEPAGDIEYDVDPNDDINMMDKGFDIFSGLETTLLNARDSLYFNEYVVNMFKTAMDGKLDVPRRDLRNRDIKYNDDSLLDYEVEYILYGKYSDKQNYKMVVTTIFTIRTILNVIHLYTEPEKNGVILTLATSMAGWWTAGLGIPVFKAIISGLWAMGESVLDVKKLLSGEEVAFIKTKNEWFTWKDSLIDECFDIASKAADEVVETVYKRIDKGFGELEEFIESKLGKISDESSQIIRQSLESLDNELNRQIDSTEQAIELAIYRTMENCLNSYSFESDSLDVYGEFGVEMKNSIKEYAQDHMKENESGFFSYEKISEHIDDFLMQGEIKKKKTDYIEKLISVTENKIEEQKEEIQKFIKSTIDDINIKGAEIAENEKNAALEIIEFKLEGMKNSEEFRGKFDLANKSEMNDADKTSISLLKFSYLDYIRLFLLLSNKENKIVRTQDIVQINMMSDNASFRLSSAQTAILMNSDVNINILFMNLPFMPDIAKDIGEGKSLYKLNFKEYISY